MKCKICRIQTTPVIDFGNMPIANNFVKSIEEDTFRFRMSTSFCEDCLLFQLDEQPKPEQMFHNSYPFFTGLSEFMKLHFKEFAENHTKTLEIEKSFVVEIGSNDGTFLENIKHKKLRHLGIDPSENVVQKSIDKGINAEVNFFGSEVAKSVVKNYGYADRIFAANVVCHVEDLNDFISGIKKLLSKNGEFIFEEPYIGSMIEKTSYDQIYDEHIYIFGILSIQKIFHRHGLTLVDAIPQITHGGSMRYVIKHVDAAEETSRLSELVQQEIDLGLDGVDVYLQFAVKCQQNKIELLSLLNQFKKEGKRVAGYAATSKSTTILNFCGITTDLIEFISDSTPEKIGCLSPGSHIPIVSHEAMKANLPDFLVLFAWNHETEILRKEKNLGVQGVKWIRFVPKVKVLELNEVY
jgi:methylation protein EvaC